MALRSRRVADLFPAELTAHRERVAKRRSPTFERSSRKRPPVPADMIAYDLETTNIAAGTPRPLYITAYGATLDYENECLSFKALHLILVNNFLTEEHHGVKFVAWFGNGFDAYLVAVALIADERFTLRPYLTNSNALRGLRVSLREDGDTRTGRTWEFVDGMAMLGFATTPLDKFLETFAPEWRKLKGNIDFSKEQFNPANPAHREYAKRDSVGLYHAMVRAQAILLERFHEPLRVTMGATCIRIFRAHMPLGVKVPTPRPEVIDMVRSFVMRGGYCYCVRTYAGPVWKYDLNQAYAAAMRDTALPCGFTDHCEGRPPEGHCAIVRVSATNPANKIPFYCRIQSGGRIMSAFALTSIADAWITSSELKQLDAEGWEVTAHESWYWADYFSMTEYVRHLEHERMTCPGGPSGPHGTIIKGVGNHSYGKTAEQLEPIEFLLSAANPGGEWAPYYPDDDDAPLQHVWCRFVEDQREKDYHQPQLAAFITAHVRMVVRRAALLAPDAWLYADTDCVMFSRDVTDQLDIDAKRYGAWKIEEAGTRYKVIAKKVYTQDLDAQQRADWHSDDPKRREAVRKATHRSAKGLNVKRLNPEDFDAWHEGRPPAQTQVQRQSFLKVLEGAEMFRLQDRRGTAVVPTPEP
jgi:hypothetical protein